MSVFELSQMEVVHPNLHEPEGVAIDREGYAYCGGAADGVIRRISPDGSIKEIAKTGGHPLGITLDLENNILVCDPGAGALLKVTQEGKSRQLPITSGTLASTSPTSVPS